MPGTPDEHYDVVEAVRRRAVAAGAVPISYPRGTGNVIASRTANIDLQPVRGKNLLEVLDALGLRPLIMAALMRIERNQVYLTADTAQQFYQTMSVRGRIVDAAQEYVLEGNTLAPRNRQGPAAIHQLP